MEGKYGGVVVSMSGFDLKLGSSQGCEFLKIFFLCATPPPIINQSSPSPPQKKNWPKWTHFPDKIIIIYYVPTFPQNQPI